MTSLLVVAGIAYLQSSVIALNPDSAKWHEELYRGEGVAYERQKDYVEDGDYISFEVIQLDDGTFIIIEEDDIEIV